MARSGVMLSVAVITITISQAWGACQDYTCSYNPPEGKSKTTMTIDTGDSCAYNTQAGDSYPPPRGQAAHSRIWHLREMFAGVDCVVNYELGTCSRMKFECDSLNLRNKDDIPWRCKGGKKGGDRMIIYGHLDGNIYRETRKWVIQSDSYCHCNTKYSRYCRSRAPMRVRSTEGLKVNLTKVLVGLSSHVHSR